MAAGPSTDFDIDGYAVVADVVPPETVEALALAFDRAGDGEAVLRREGTLYGMRDVFRQVPEVARLARSGPLLDLVRPVLGSGAFPVRALLFDKTPGANWGVPWHQDLTIAVKARVDTPGFGPWTVKAGIDHVRPPVSLLERMVTIRVHLDDSDGDRGPLRVLPGSHRDGRLGAEATRARLEHDRPVECLVERGGVVMIRPLLLHASSPATSPTRRRVVHLEYAAEPLPGTLQWFETANEGSR
jgi:ectoine hydroxylase-related dioxygenase (phytanoyl-CoA dioxygenase family)